MTTITIEEVKAAAGDADQLDELVKRALLELLQEAEDLQLRANAMGFVLTIETEALMPPAMGKYNLIATLRPSNTVYRSAS